MSYAIVSELLRARLLRGVWVLGEDLRTLSGDAEAVQILLGRLALIHLAQDKPPLVVDGVLLEELDLAAEFKCVCELTDEEAARYAAQSAPWLRPLTEQEIAALDAAAGEDGVPKRVRNGRKLVLSAQMASLVEKMKTYLADKDAVITIGSIVYSQSGRHTFGRTLATIEDLDEDL